jgi:hypothetical protein
MGENGYGGWAQCVFLFHFLGNKILAKFDLKIAKLVEFTVGYFSSTSLSKNGEISPEKKRHWMDGRLKN